ncbi:hypothetical protein ABZX95_06080 [Streptomyces sp. NPDC004232]|uniref:hypothetical protein n=1 Tax=Streptomyces sp. NPDC004232 TaxID=3154454 RepID=UPI0033B62C29
MSTEARRAPVPPRPSTPPGHSSPQGLSAPASPQALPGAPAPSAPPRPSAAPSPQGAFTSPRSSSAASPAAPPVPSNPPRPPGAGAPGGAPAPPRPAATTRPAGSAGAPRPAGPARPQTPARPSAAPGRPADSAPADDPDDEPSVFTPRAGRPSGGDFAREEQTTGAGAKPVVPEGADPASPPPPPASARFPDAPPRPGRQRPGQTGQGSRRPAAPAETASETTTRLRPVPASEPTAPGRGPTAPGPTAPDPKDPKAPEATAAETTTRLRPIPAPVPGSPKPPRGGAASAPAQASASAAAAGARRTGAGSGTTGGWSPLEPAHPAGPLPPVAVPDPALSWSAGAAARPVVSFGRPEAFSEPSRLRAGRLRAGRRTAVAATCLVLGLGLIGGAAAGSWLTGDGGSDTAADHFTTTAALWHNVPVDQLFPTTVQGTGAGPGGADRTWTRIAVAPDSGCAHAFDPLLQKVLAPVGCRRLLRATYTDATQSYVTTVGLLFTGADPAAMSALAARFRTEHLDRRTDLLPRPYAAAGTLAAGFGDKQRASWTVSVLTDAPVVAYAVSGWADGRAADAPQPAADAVSPTATTAPAQAGLGNEAQGLADRIERRLRQHIGTATENPS